MFSNRPEAYTTKARSLRYRSYLVRILTLVALLLVLLGVTHTLTPSAAKAYNCPNISPCYARNDWPGSTPGVAFQVSVGTLSCCQGNNAVISDEVWFSDCDVYSIVPCYPEAHWVETGYVKFDGDAERYFWGDSRPIDHGSVAYHPLPPIESPDYGSYTSFQITMYGQPSGQFLVYLSSNTQTWDNYSTHNTMSPSAILLGQELHGTCCASAQRAYFVANQWQGSDGNWNYQTSNGTLHYDNPPYVGWSLQPSDSSTGGQLWTNCC
jgi:hypothetical protein